MIAEDSSENTRVLLSFSSAYSEHAKRLGSQLKSANIDVRYDEWYGGGGAPAIQSVDSGVGDVGFVLAFLTPSDVAKTWIGDEWKRAVYDEARARDIDVLGGPGRR